ncbi:hypothetical protein SDC9_133647 [bioreactor metagenome]|uniref:Uncharacterized protein n=1 Tax=bioreactor metagenome TaxID=1076179 RepID=A0A645DC18_9ZZZZ|nr:hypothetical protein [Candidatus Pelethousia sp.]
MEQNPNMLAEMLAGLLESEPAYIIGRQFIQRLAAETGAGEEQAAQALLYAAPGGREVLCACAAQDLVRLQEAGRVADVEGYLADKAFAKPLLEMPAAAALRLYDTEKAAGEDVQRERDIGARDLLEKLMARRSLPSPIRGGVPAESRQDYANMSSTEFAAIKKRLALAAAQGKHPAL